MKPPPGAPMILGAMPWPLRVTRLGSVSLERLAAAEDGHGRVHSVFDHAINILWHDGRLLTLLGSAHLAAPFAVALFELPSRDVVTPGSRIRRSDFDCNQSEVVRLEMPRGPLVFHPASLPGPPCGRALSSGAGRRARRALGKSLAARDFSAFAEAAGQLIGLGEGLTPAGDDFVLGTLAAIHRLAPEWLRKNRVHCDGLLSAAGGRTTNVARDFLLEAMAGRFSEPVLDLLTARTEDLANRAARELLGLGATSGADTLAGIQLGCRSLGAASVPVIA